MWLESDVEYMCLRCGTYNCNSGKCLRCGSLQFGSPEYKRHAEREEERKRIAKLSPEEFAEHQIKERRQEREEATRQERERIAEQQRLAVTLPQRALWEQRQKEPHNAELVRLLKPLGLVLAVVALAAIVCYLAPLAGLGTMSSWALGALPLSIGAAAIRLGRNTKEPPPPPPPGEKPTYSRAPRSDRQP
jgi:predicted  nucleic acid-binding Zn-ribbon protein